MWLRLRSAYEDKIGEIGVAGCMKAVRHLNLKIREDKMVVYRQEPVDMKKLDPHGVYIVNTMMEERAL